MTTVLPHLVLTYSPISGYDDRLDRHYDFPHGGTTGSYKKAVDAALRAGGVAVFYWPEKPQSALSKTYFALARPVAVVPHPTDRTLSRLLVQDYLPLPKPVPVGNRGNYLGATHGNFVKAVRGLSEPDLRRILHLGGMMHAETTHPRVLVESRRAARDRAFRERVLAAYGGRCALTGLTLRADLAGTDGWTGFEAEAAHIRPVAGRHGGSDDVRNGLPMLRTLHWLFDRGLLSAEPGGRILISPSLSAQADARPVLGLIRHQAGIPRLLDPVDPSAGPDPDHLDYHRREIFCREPIRASLRDLT
jgi:putative restriction endonuclease